jgi:hypothetical protein
MSVPAPPSLDDPKDDWLVYADALQNAGDPLGELIALNQAVEDGASASQRDAFLDDNADAIYGSLAPFRGQVEVDWKWSVPRTLALKIGPKDDQRKLLDALFGSPLASRMRSLSLVAQTPGYARVDLGPTLAQLRERLPHSCTGLELIDERAKDSRILVSADYSPDRNLVDFGDLDVVWSIPQLERLHMYVADTEQIQLGQIDAPELRDFAFLGLRWVEPYGGQSRMSEALAAAKWPKLERLALRIPETFTYSWPEQYGAYVPVDRYDEENEYYDDDDEGWHEDLNWSAELEGLLTQLQETSIKHLSLTSFASSTNLLTALDDHGLPPSLEVLDLSQSDLDDGHVAWMLEHRALFAQLRVLDLSDTLIGDPSPLSELGPDIVHSSGGGSIYRFAVGME